MQTGDDNDLIEPEGVNAGSAEATEQPDEQPEGDLLGGGDPAAAPAEADGVDDRDLTGAPPVPEPHDAESAHDNGLLD